MTKDLLQDVQVDDLESFENLDELKTSLFSDKYLIMDNFLA